jgi:threonine synthase
MKWFYRCPACGADYDLAPGRYLCDVCAAAPEPGRPPAGILECQWEGDWPDNPALHPGARGVAALAGIPLPVEPDWFPRLPVGGTPLWAPERLRAATGFPQLWLKDETVQPSASLKDRASWLVAAFARKHRIAGVCLASTGNAASSMACVGAAAGLAVTVFLPAAAPEAKRIQVLQYGAELRPVAGNYDHAYDQSLDWSKTTGVLSRNTAYNPLTIEGKKTVAFEICRELGGAPDQVFVPCGDGVILAGVYKGFEDLLRLGRIGRMPTLWACQASGSSAIARALASGGFGPPVPSSTVADSIAVDIPRNGRLALAKLQRHRGRAVVVDDAAILAAQRRLSAGAGLFAEPAAACAYAGFLQAAPQLDPESRVVVLITGSGLKDIAGAARGLAATSDIPAAP